MKINCYLSDRYGCGHYRILQPYREIQRVTDWDIRFYNEYIPDEMQGCNIWVLQRETRHGAFKNMRIAQANGVKIIYELDDWLLNVHEWDEKAFAYFGRIEIHENIKYFLTYADLITVSTEYLKKLVQPYNRNVHVYKNCLNVEVWNRHYLNKKKSECFTIGYSGSESHIKDLEMIREDLISVMLEYPEIKLKFVGWDFRKNLDFSKVIDRVEWEAPASFYKYGEKLNYDLALAPLLDTEFNRAKSNVKALEHGIMGVLVLASELTPYLDVCDGERGSIVVREKDWLKEIRSILSHYDALKNYTDKRREEIVRFYNQKTNVIERIEGLINL